MWGICALKRRQWTKASLSWSIFLPIPELTFAWIFNEYPYFVQQDSRRFISQETGSLYIAKVEPSDVGNYTCVVNNTVTREKVLSSPTPLVLRSDGKCLKQQTTINLYLPGLSHYLCVRFTFISVTMETIHVCCIFILRYMVVSGHCPVCVNLVFGSS